MTDPLRVAVIDDDAAQLELLSQIVARQRPGWLVAAVVADEAWIDTVRDDARAALDGATAAIIDYRLAGCEVIELVPVLAAVARVVVMSGSTDGIDERTCLDAGARAVVAKPFSLDQAERMLTACDRAFAEA